MNALFDAVIRGAIRNRIAVILTALVITLIGVRQIQQARLDALPGFTPPMVTIQTEAPGYGSSEVEQRVTAPLEQGLPGIPGVTQVRSTSYAGLSVIELTFRDGTNIFHARQLVNERLTQSIAELPVTIPAPQLAPIVSPIGALLKFTYTVDSDNTGVFRDLSRFVRWSLAPRLRAIGGVARVTVHGAAALRVEIRPDFSHMIARNIRFSDLRRAVAHAQGTAAPGHVNVGAQRIPLRAKVHWSNKEINKLADTVVKMHGQRPIRLRDVADIDIGSAPAVGYAVQDGRRAVYVQVDKLPWADTLDLTERVQHIIAETDHLVPRGCRREAPVFRQADFIRTSLWSVGRAMLIGSGLVIIMLLMFLGSLRVAGISLIALPLSMLTAVTVLLLKGATINGMVLGGLAIAVGEVVDDAIVDVENIWRRLQQNAGLSSPRPMLEVIHDASIEIRGAVVYASLIIVVVLVPILAVGGLAGRIFSPLAEAYALAISSSLIVALTITPAMSALLLNKKKTLGTRDSTITLYADRTYERILAIVRRRPGTTVLTTLVIGISFMIMLPLIGGGFLPEFREGVLIAEVSAWPGTSLGETTRLAKRIMGRLLGPGHVPHVAARIGRAALDEDSAPVYRIEMDLKLPPDSGDPEEVAARVRRQFSTMPGIRFSVDGFLGERINELLAGERAPIAIKLKGDDLAVLRKAASILIGRLARIPGLQSIRSRNLVDVPTMDIVPRDAALVPAGVMPAEIARTIAAGKEGLPVTELTGPNGFKVPVVFAPSSAFADAGRLPDFPIWTNTGNVLPMSALTNIVDGTEPAYIQHEMGQRVVTLTATARQADLSAIAGAIGLLLRDGNLPPGITWETAGQAVERHRASTRLFLIAIIVIGAVMVFLWMAFRSFTDSLVIILGIPVGLAGGVIAALLLPDGLSLAGLIGFVTLTGIICRNGIMLVSHKNHLFSRYPGEDPGRLIVRAARDRLRPILMTAFTAFGGLLPLAISLGKAGSELESPMAVIVCGGLLTSTILNLLAVPAFYLWRSRSSISQEF
ncbi:MAG: efflux RND transporter permease subunit [Deltaproteobacteria bacterium]|nr:efflux RND transporter permease subunit [Deltaproteobacteria bacterium]